MRFVLKHPSAMCMIFTVSDAGAATSSAARQMQCLTAMPNVRCLCQHRQYACVWYMHHAAQSKKFGPACSCIRRQTLKFIRSSIELNLTRKLLNQLSSVCPQWGGWPVNSYWPDGRLALLQRCMDATQLQDPR